MPGLLGEKIGMTQIFTPEGQRIPVTVLQVGPCQVILKRVPDKEGYGAVQLGYQEVDKKKKNKPYGGHFLKKKLKVFRFLKELRTEHPESYQTGDQLTVNLFQVGDVVHVSGVSKGKGFQGVMKRYHFRGGARSHGCSVSHRAGGSIGQNTYPGKVFKGKKMAGQMGNKQVTTKNLKVVGVEPEQNILLIRGAVPGGKHSIVVISPATEEFEKRKTEQTEKQPEAKAAPAPKEEKKEAPVEKKVEEQKKAPEKKNKEEKK